MRSLTHASPKNSRDGLLLITTLVALILAATLMGLLFRLLIHQRTHLKREAQRIQARSLLLSGFNRAQSRLRADPDYSGETWSLTPAELPGGAEVTIAVHPHLSTTTPSTTRSRRLDVAVTAPPNSSGTRLADTRTWSLPELKSEQK